VQFKTLTETRVFCVFCETLKVYKEKVCAKEQKLSFVGFNIILKMHGYYKVIYVYDIRYDLLYCVLVIKEIQVWFSNTLSTIYLLQ